MITIDEEAKSQRNLLINFGNFAEKYKTVSQNLIVSSLEVWGIEKNIFYLLRHSKVKPFNNKYRMKPDYLSYDEYNTVVLAPLLMYVNNVLCIEDFDLVDVIVPDYEAIISIAKDRVPQQDVDKLKVINW